ncbi:HNH endonuclease, partial [Staphylococcus hominis]
MTRSISRSFYRSNRWKKCRNAYMQSQNYICERCGNLADICHHKIWLNESNVDDPM